MNRRIALSLLSLLLLLALTTVSHAATSLYASRAAWTTDAVTWADIDLTPYGEYSTLTSVALPALATPATTLSFDVTQTVYQVGSSWATWSGGNTPRVLYNPTSSVNGTFDAAVRGFGLEMEPNAFGLFDMTLKLADGTSLTSTVDGNGGAAFFGFLSDVGVTGWTASTSSSADGFGMGRMVITDAMDHNGSPELSTWMLLACSGLAGLVIRRRRRS
jgi:hypothetical protein